MIIVSYMNYALSNNSKDSAGTAALGQLLWQWIVFLGVLVVSALDSQKP
jgi:hypothetical protein